MSTVSQTPAQQPVLQRLFRAAVVVWVTLCTGLGLLSLLPWFGVALFSAVLFDAGRDSELASMIVWVALFPVFVIGTVCVSWFLYSRNRLIAASLVAITNLLPVAWIAAYS